MSLKNFFLKDKDKKKVNRWVLTPPASAPVDLKKLGKDKSLGAKGGFSFATDLEDFLGYLS